MKRILGSLLLMSLVASIALPCQAAFMSCGMELPSAAERCASCDGSRSAVPSLTAGSCCTVEPGQELGIAPAISAGSAPGPALPDRDAVAAVTTGESAPEPACACIAAASPGATGPPLSVTRSVTLQL